VPVEYPVACHPQAWAAGTIPYLLVATLGLEPDGFARVLRIRDPRLPEGIEGVELRDLPVGGGTAHVAFERVGSRTVARTVATTDGVTVSVAETT
jgi:glycogen debranching enzyme